MTAYFGPNTLIFQSYKWLPILLVVSRNRDKRTIHILFPPRLPLVNTWFSTVLLLTLQCSSSGHDKKAIKGANGRR